MLNSIRPTSIAIQFNETIEKPRREKMKILTLADNYESMGNGITISIWPDIADQMVAYPSRQSFLNFGDRLENCFTMPKMSKIHHR